MGKYSTPRKCRYCAYTSIHSSTLARHSAACSERSANATPEESRTMTQQGINATNGLNNTSIITPTQLSSTSCDASTPYSPKFMSSSSFHHPIQRPRSPVQLQNHNMQQAPTTIPFQIPRSEVIPSRVKVKTPVPEMPSPPRSSFSTHTPRSVSGSVNHSTPTTFDSDYRSVLRNENPSSPAKEKHYDGDHSPALFKLCVAMMEQVQKLNQSQQSLIVQVEQQSRVIRDLRNRLH